MANAVMTWDERRAWFVQHMPWSMADETLVVLKGHLLIEAVMRELAMSKLRKPAALIQRETMFNTVLNICKAVGEPDEDWTWAMAGALNKLRNELAHRIESPDLDDVRKVFLSVAHQEAVIRTDVNYREATDDLERIKLAVMYLFIDIVGRIEGLERADPPKDGK